MKQIDSFLSVLFFCKHDLIFLDAKDLNVLKKYDCSSVNTIDIVIYLQINVTM